jgi:hypothetical protein
MRRSVVLLLCSLAGVIGGAALIGLPAMGGAIIFDSMCMGAYALLHDDGAPSQPSVSEVPTLAGVLERARRAG